MLTVHKGKQVGEPKFCRCIDVYKTLALLRFAQCDGCSLQQRESTIPNKVTYEHIPPPLFEALAVHRGDAAVHKLVHRAPGALCLTKLRQVCVCIY